MSGPDGLYDEDFYTDVSRSSNPSAEVIVPLVTSLVQPASVLDVGCGPGSWLRSFANGGVDDYLGIDQELVPASVFQVPAEHFRTVDLSSGAFDLGRRFDLVVCLEVAEHLPGAAADALVASLTAHADAVLFSAAIPGQGGTGHVNEQWQSWWAGKFAAAGYLPHDVVRPRVWHDARVAWWYSQNALLYLNRSAPPVGSPDPPGVGLVDVVHPTPYREQRELQSVRLAARVFGETVGRSVRRRLAARRGGR